MWNLLYLGGNVWNVGLLAWFVVVSLRVKRVTYPGLWVAALLLGLMGYECYREVLRCLGQPVLIGAHRLTYVNYLYFLLGMFYREVILYAD